MKKDLKHTETGVVKNNNHRITLVKAFKIVGKVLSAPFVFLGNVVSCFSAMDNASRSDEYTESLKESYIILEDSIEDEIDYDD